MRLLLDTCTFLWAASDLGKLSTRVRSLLEDESNELFLSAASVWEIVRKYRHGRLELGQPPETFVPLNREAGGIQPLPLDEEASLLARKLPDHHRDPFDRMLICQAIAGQLTILTPDPLIRQYPVRTAW